MVRMARPPAPRLTPRPSPGAATSRGPAVTETVPDPAPPRQVELDLTDTQALELLAPGGTTEHTAQRRWTVVEPEAAATRSPVVRESLRGLRAGLEAVLISWLLVTIPVVAAYVATVASTALGEASWFDAARSASAGWLLGLGQELAVTGADGAVSSVSLAPVSLTAITALLIAGGVRRARLRHPVAFVVAALASFVVIACAYGVAEASPSPRALLTSAAVVGGAVLVGAGRSGALPAAPSSPLVAAAIAGLRAGLGLAGALLALGGVTVVVTLIARASLVTDIQSALAPGFLNLAILVLAQLLALPTFMVWALAWWLGPGFSIGIIEVTSTAVTSGPLPVLPVLAALPDAGPGPGAWVVLVPVLLAVAVLARAVVRAPATVRGWRGEVVLLATATLTLGVVMAVLAGLSGGAAGAAVGPLAGVGTVTAAVTLAALWVTATAAAVAWLLVALARRLDLVGRYPLLGELAQAGRRVGAGLRSNRWRRRFSRRT